MRKSLPILIVTVLALSTMGCSGATVEERAREVQEKMKDSLGPDVEALAVAQTIDPAVAKEVQTGLAAIDEYQGEINGKLDTVTVNAIQSFQRSAGLEDNGIVDERTRERLKAAASGAKQKPKTGAEERG